MTTKHDYEYTCRVTTLPMDAFEIKSAAGLGEDIAAVVISDGQIERRVDELACEIAECYAGKELTILAVLTGSLIFLADLIRRLPLRTRIDVVSVRSYPGRATESRGPQLTIPLRGDLEGRDVLIVDDILDTGQTLETLAGVVAAAEPASVRTCVLLRKRRKDLPSRLEPDFVGFDVPHQFLVGYGLDFDGLYRNLPDICILKTHARKELT